MKSEAIFKQLSEGFEKMSEEDRKAQMKKANSIFQLDIKDGEEVRSWTIDMKKEGKVKEEKAQKADVTIGMSDKDFVELSEGRANAQSMFMKGQLKLKGNAMTALKLTDVLKAIGPAASKL